MEVRGLDDYHNILCGRVSIMLSMDEIMERKWFYSKCNEKGENKATSSDDEK